MFSQLCVVILQDVMERRDDFSCFGEESLLVGQRCGRPDLSEVTVEVETDWSREGNDATRSEQAMPVKRTNCHGWPFPCAVLVS